MVGAKANANGNLSMFIWKLERIKHGTTMRVVRQQALYLALLLQCSVSATSSAFVVSWQAAVTKERPHSFRHEQENGNSYRYRKLANGKPSEVRTIMRSSSRRFSQRSIYSNSTLSSAAPSSPSSPFSPSESSTSTVDRP